MRFLLKDGTSKVKHQLSAAAGQKNVLAAFFRMVSFEKNDLVEILSSPALMSAQDETEAPSEIG